MKQTLSRFSLSAIKSQLSKIWVTVIVATLVSLGGAGTTVLVAKLTGNPIWKLTKDPADVKDFPSYIGMLSNWDVILWVAVAAICLFSAAVLSQQKAPAKTVGFFVVSGGFSFLLGIDDLYMLHDQLLPELLNIREMFFYLLYFLAFAVYLLLFISSILKYEYLLFFAALGLLLLSRRMFIELPFDNFKTTGDMLKYFGIVFWLAFFYRTALYEVGTLSKRESA